MSTSCLPQAAAVLLGLVASLAHATEISLQQAVERALQRNESLRAEQAGVTATRHQAAMDGLAPALTVGAELENLGGTGALSGTQSAETTLRLGRLIELGGKRRARRALGDAQLGLQQLMQERRRLDLATDTTHRFIRVATRQAELDLAERQVELARSHRDAIARSVRGGSSPDSDLDLAELELIRADLEHEDAGHEFASARVALSVLWGEREPGFERAHAELGELPSVEPFEILVERLAGSAEQQAYAREDARLRASESVARAAARPDVQASVGVRHLEALDDQAIVLSVSMPLGTAQRSSLTLNRQRAEAEGLAARSTLASLDAYRELFASYEELKHARHEAETLGERMIPRAERVLAAMQRGYEQSRYSFIQVTQTRAVLLGLQRDGIDAAARYHHLLADIDRATATSGGTQP